MAGTSTSWRWRRMIYYASLCVFFFIAVYFLRNQFMFGKWTWLAPEDFKSEAEQRCSRTVIAVKQYQRDHKGKLPNQVEELVPDYLAAQVTGVEIDEGQLRCWTRSNHIISYNFDPAAEGWSVSGVFVTGKIPLPPVPNPASTQP